MQQCEINGAEIHSRAGLHDVLSRTLQLPAWYGRNLDALHDCLTDISTDTILYITHPDALRTGLDAYAEIFLQVLTDAAGENPHFHYEIKEEAAT